MDNASSLAEMASRLDALPTLYGNIQLVWVHEDRDELPESFDSEFNDGSRVSGMEDNGSTLGVKHEHEISPGVTGFLKLELEGISADDKANSSGINALDEAYIGVKGDFGTFWAGSDDSQFETMIVGIANYYEYGGQNIGHDFDTGEGNLLQYTSPSFGGVKVLAAVALEASGNDSSKYPYQVGVMYEADVFSLSVAMDSNDGADSASNENTYGIAADVNLDDLGLRAEYSTRSEKSGEPGLMSYGLMATYTLGANAFAASYEYAEPDEGDEETTVISLQALHNLSDNMYVYVEGYMGNYDNGSSDGDISELAVGGVYYF
jgi:predicted porin